MEKLARKRFEGKIESAVVCKFQQISLKSHFAIDIKHQHEYEGNRGSKQSTFQKSVD